MLTAAIAAAVGWVAALSPTAQGVAALDRPSSLMPTAAPIGAAVEHLADAGEPGQRTVKTPFMPAWACPGTVQR
jgi:hypothetical protein